MTCQKTESTEISETIFQDISRHCKFLLILCTLLACTACQPPDFPKAEKGSLDLSQWDFSQKGSARLDGNWAIFRSQLLLPAKFSSPDAPKKEEYIQVPGFWSGQDKLSYATLIIDITLPNSSQPLALRIGDVNSAYRLWINGELAAKVGKVATSLQDEQAAFAVQIIPLPKSSKQVQLVLQLSNFHNLNTGITDSISLGDKKLLQKTSRRDLGHALLISGCLLIIGLYHQLLFLIRLKDRSLLYFGLLSSLIGVSFLASNSTEHYLLDLLPFLSIDTFNRIDMFTFYLSVPITLMYIQTLFPRESSKFVLLCFQTVALFCISLVLFTSPSIFFQTLNPYYAIAAVGLFYASWISIRAARNKREGSYWFLAGFGIFFISGMCTILYSARIIYIGYTLPIGILALMVSQSFMLALKFIKAHYALLENNKLKEELAKREATEQDLRETHNTLSSILNSLDDAVIAVNESLEITFCNAGCENLLAQSAEHLLGKPFSSLLATEEQQRVDHMLTKAINNPDNEHFIELSLSIDLHSDTKTIPCSLKAGCMELNDENILVIIPEEMNRKIHVPHSASNGFLAEINRHRRHIKLLQENLENSKVFDQNINIDAVLLELDSALSRMEQSQEGSASVTCRRELAIKGMQTALRYWEESTGTGKPELARKSGLWKVYVNHDGYERTQTLDKYLSPDLMPKIPRWGKIHQTITFVLNSCSSPSSLRCELERLFSTLKKT